MQEDTGLTRTTRREALWWVWRERITERASERLVLMTLAYAVDEEGRANVTYKWLVEKTRLSLSGVKAALTGLSGKDLVEIVDKGRGRPHEFLLDLGRGVVGNPPGFDPLVLASHNAFDGLKQRLIEPTDVGSTRVAHPSAVRVDGRDLAFDAVQEVCGIQPGSPRLKEIPSALNGPSGIRAQAYPEIVEWFRVHCLPMVEGGEYEDTLAVWIRERARLYREKMAGVHITPSALKKWWTDLPTMAVPSKHGTSRDALAVAEAAVRRARGEGV